MARRLVMISTSTVFGTRYLEHAFRSCATPSPACRASSSSPRPSRTATATRRSPRGLREMGTGSTPSTRRTTPVARRDGGGRLLRRSENTFRLLKALYEMGVLPLIRQRGGRGHGLLGASAGSNLACPTIRTTNDMPIVEPPSFDALSLVPFQINPHYVEPGPRLDPHGRDPGDADPGVHEENETPVVGLREGAILRVEGDSILLKGMAGARIFRRGQDPVEAGPVAELGPTLA